MTRVGVTATMLSACLLWSAACEREARRFQSTPAETAHPDAVRLSSLQPGGGQPAGDEISPYQKNAYGLAEGKRLFTAFNCNGCHASGGGGIGPALMDDKWIYGYKPDQIASSIIQGRPDGMPAFAGKIPDAQVWQLVAYIQSLTVSTPRDAAPSRNDDMALTPGEQRLDRQQRVQTGHR